MYAPFFGLSQEPFSIAPDPRYLFMSERHREALAHLLYGARGGGGFVLLTGEIGAGKTTICRCFMEQVPAHCRVAYIFNPRQSAAELLRSVCEDFGLTQTQANAVQVPASDAVPDAGGLPALGGASLKADIDALNTYLLGCHAQGQSNILIIDEAQLLSADVLEQLRLLTNLETSERKLLQIMLIGQPELRDMLARPELEQLAQRVIARYHLDALDAQETAQYIHHRLLVAGLRTASPFQPEAVERIWRWSRGVPRRINLLCDRAMLGAYAQSMAEINRATVDQAGQEVFGHLLTRRSAASTSAGTPQAAPRAEGGDDHSVGLARAGWSRRRPALLWALTGLGAAVALAGGVMALRDAHQTPSDATQRQLAGPQGTSNTAVSGWSTSLSTAPTGGALAAPAMSGAPTASTGTNAGSAGASQPHVEGPSDGSSEKQAWRALGTLWGATLDNPDPCEQARTQQLACFRSNEGLALIRLLGRPVLLLLAPEAGASRGAPPTPALLLALGPDTATLRVGAHSHTVPLVSLAQRWQGEFATLWRTPPAYRRRLELGSRGPAVAWLHDGLARHAGLPDDPNPPGVAPDRFDAKLAERVRAFQIAQGLKPDGVAGATTLMRLSQLQGVAEPRLGNATLSPNPAPSGAQAPKQ